ncbi:MAG: hypothetical protein ACM3PF_13115 [Bacteroidota bacterium]
MDRDDAGALAPRAELPAALFLLGVASAAFDVGCVLIKTPFLRPGITAGDAIEAAGVFVVLALFARAGRLARPGSVASALAGVAAVSYAFGHGIHVAANSIHDFAELRHAGDPIGLLDFWDERVGHYLVEIGRVLFAVSLLGAPAPRGAAKGAALAALGGAAYGFIAFASAVEGQTVPVALPFYALVAAVLLWRARKGGRGEPRIRAFFLAAAATALVLFAVWGVWRHGFPEFTKTGILRGANPHSPAGGSAPGGGE